MAADVLGAVRDALTSRLGWNADAVILGWRNRAALPSGGEFAVLTLAEATPRGGCVRSWRDDGEGGVTETVSMLAQYAVLVELCGEEADELMARAARLTAWANGPEGVEALRERGLSCLYAEGPRADPYEDAQRRWVTRYAVTLRLCGWVRGDMAREGFGGVTLRVENVDEHHPVTE